jgi:hypothetical protein
MSRIARIIITVQCDRYCAMCCNRYPSIIRNAKRISSLNNIRDYDEVIISGGEPLLCFDKTYNALHQLKIQNNKLMYLYTAKSSLQIHTLLPLLDGLTFTLHDNVTSEEVDNFHHLQNSLSVSIGKQKPFMRLVIISGIKERLFIQPVKWNYIKIKPMMTEEELIAMSLKKDGIPLNETLFLLSE